MEQIIPRLDGVRRMLALVIEDVQKDASEIDGQLLTGKSVGTQFGHLLAMVDGVARGLVETLDILAAVVTELEGTPVVSEYPVGAIGPHTAGVEIND